MKIVVIPETDEEKARFNIAEHENVNEFFLFGNKMTGEGVIDFHDWRGSYRYLVGSMSWFEEEIKTECDESRAKIHEVLGPINLGSASQLTEALESQGVVLTKRTGSGKYSVDKKVLEALSKEYPIVDDILFLRGSEKIMNTYAIGIHDKLTENDLIHMNFNQNVTTGRMSCREPNVQNIPRGDTRIRKAFIVPPEHYFIFADYSQVEVRLTAHFSEDPLMLDAYAKNQDVHTRTACEMFDLDYDETMDVLTKEEHVCIVARKTQLVWRITMTIDNLTKEVKKGNEILQRSNRLIFWTIIVNIVTVITIVWAVLK